MKIRKIMISTLMGITLLSGQVFAGTPVALSLDQAMKLATTNDPELNLMDDKVALAEKELIQVNANADYKRKESVYEHEKAAYVAHRKSYLLTPIKKEHSVASIKRQRDAKLNSIKLELMSQYFDVQTKMDGLNDAKRSLATIQREIQAKSKELTLGKITQLDFNSYEIKKLETESAVKKAEIDLEASYMKFASVANQSLDYKFTPAALSKSVTSYEVKDLVAILTNERTKNSDLLAKQASIKEMELEIKINTESKYEMGNTDSATNVLQNDLNAAQKDLANIESNIDLNLKLDYYRLQSNYDGILVSKAGLALTQKELDVAKVKYDVGNISLMDYLAKQEAFDKAESSYNNAVHTYQVAVEKFKMTHFVQ